MKYLYYIMDSVGCSDSTDGTKDVGVRIFAVPIEYPEIRLADADGPFQSIRNLKRSSPIFKRLVTKGSKYVQRVLEEKNVHIIKDFIWTPKGKSYHKDFIKLIDHTVKGHIKDKKVFGLHFFDSTKMRVKKQINEENEFGVWKALIELYDDTNSIWIEKIQPTTFFPISWTINQLFHECDYAFMNKIKDGSSMSKYISKTISGINVEIIINEGIVKSIYPIYE